MKFVPALHNNSSTLESTSSCLRAARRDTSILLEKALIAINVADSEKQVSSKSYSAEDSMEENKNLWDTEFDLTSGPKSREKWFGELIRQQDKEGKQDETEAVERPKLSCFLAMSESSLSKEEKNWLAFVGTVEDAPSFPNSLRRTRHSEILQKHRATMK